MTSKYATTIVLVISAFSFMPAASAAESIDSRTAHHSAASIDNRRDQMVHRIDELVLQQWDRAGVQPAALASDGEFLRRAYLDLCGVIPRVWVVREFLADPRPDKRQRLVEELLVSPRYATHMATVWRNRILPQGVDSARAREALGLQAWLRARFARNLSYDNLVSGLLLATGDDELGPALFFQANDLAPEKLAASCAELFLGVRLQCAQCHDHPYADWSQRDFWGLAAFFARVEAPENRGMGMSYRIIDTSQGEVQLPDSEEVVAPKYLRGETDDDDRQLQRRARLALWTTSRSNRFFASAAVNWAWNHFFGRGLVETLDHAAGESDEQPGDRHGQLLDELADYFVLTGFDLRELLLTIASTRAYQLSSRHDQPELAAPDLFARMLPKTLTPEQFYDSFLVLAPRVLASDERAFGPGRKTTGSLVEDPLRMQFVRRMRAPPGNATEFRTGTLQALMLMNGVTTAELTAAGRSSLLGALAAPFMTEQDRVDALFLATLCRHPDEEERAAFVDALGDNNSHADQSRALADILWALVNSTEFAFNR